MREDLSVWNFSHEKFDDDLKFLDLDSESFCTVVWAFPQCLHKTGMRLGVLELDSLNPSEVVQVPSVLVIGSILGEIGFDDKLAGLFIQVLGKVRSENHICDSCLSNQVLSEACSFE